MLKIPAWPAAMICGCENWTTEIKDENRKEAFEMFGLRTMLQLSVVDNKEDKWLGIK